MRRPGFEPGHVPWKGTVIAIRPPTLIYQNAFRRFKNISLSQRVCETNLNHNKCKCIMKSDYVSNASSEHARVEEAQWAEILSAGNQYAGMLLIHDQKLCALGHEVAAAIKAGEITERNVVFYAGRLEKRIGRVAEVLKAGASDFKVNGTFERLRKVLISLRNDPASYACFQEMPEKVHMASHELCDELQERIKAEIK